MNFFSRNEATSPPDHTSALNNSRQKKKKKKASYLSDRNSVHNKANILFTSVRAEAFLQGHRDFGLVVGEDLAGNSVELSTTLGSEFAAKQQKTWKLIFANINF